jgi:hypothetical protein
MTAPHSRGVAEEISVRGLLAMALASAALLCGCDKPSGEKASASPEDANRPRAEVNANSPYTGQWAAAASSCDDQKKVWTIEPHRMGVRRVRFCYFKSIYLKQRQGSDDAVWTAAADCLADGHASKEFVFFRMKPNLREMRVTFNDSRPVDLMRCAARS